MHGQHPHNSMKTCSTKQNHKRKKTKTDVSHLTRERMPINRAPSSLLLAAHTHTFHHMPNTAASTTIASEEHLSQTLTLRGNGKLLPGDHRIASADMTGLQSQCTRLTSTDARRSARQRDSVYSRNYLLKEYFSQTLLTMWSRDAVAS